MLDRTPHESDPDPPAAAHVVHLYRRPRSLQLAVVNWIHPSLDEGGGALLLCTAANARAVRARLREEGADPAALEAEGRLLVTSAEESLASFTRAGRIDPVAFQSMLCRLTAKVRRACPADRAELRAWGEMVDVLWRDGQAASARELEELWSREVGARGIRLLCSYDVGRLDHLQHAALWEDVCRTHDHVVYDAGGTTTRPPAAVPTALLDACATPPKG